MKFFKSFFIRYSIYLFTGIGALLILELGAMIYVNDVYLADNSAYSVVKVTRELAATLKYESVDVGIDSAQEAGSFDGRYVASLSGGTVSITDLASGDKAIVGNVSGMKAEHFQWLYDRDWLAIAEKSDNATRYPNVKLYSYDIADKTLTEIRNNTANQDLKIQLSSNADSVTQIDMSTGTGVTYVKVTGKNGTSKLWKVNSFVGVERMENTIEGDIGKIVCLKTADDLLYEDSSNGRVYRYSTGSSLSINGTRSLKLLGIDSADNVYLAAMSNGKTKTVYYGSVSAGRWNAVSLGKTVDPADIYVTFDGGVYLNDTSNSSISKVLVGGQSLQTDSKTPKSSSESGASSSQSQADMAAYKGRLLDVFVNGFITIDNGYAVHNEIT
jgi:hypothetical protein